MTKQILSLLLVSLMLLVSVPCTDAGATHECDCLHEQTNLSEEVQASGFLPQWPVKKSFTINVLSHYSSGGQHRGIDIPNDGSNNQEIYAVAAGVVDKVSNTCSCGDPKTGCDCGSSWGNYIRIKHSIGGKTYYSLYAHLLYNSISVSKGASVSAGTKIAKMGSSGNSTGYHLHLELHEGDRTADKAQRSFDYYVNNITVLNGVRITKHNASSSEDLYRNWILNNCELRDGYYYVLMPSGEDTITVSGYTCPTSLLVGSKFGIRGTVTSGVSNITSLTAGVFDQAGNMMTGKTVSPNTRTYDLLNVNNDIIFNILPVGDYYYRITATNSTATYTVLNEAFNVYSNEPTIYTVEYRVDGATIKSYAVEQGKTLPDIPAVPTKTGYTGVWDTDRAGVAIQQNYTVNAVYASMYNSNDVACLVAFLEQTDEKGVKNGTKLNESYNPNDPATFAGVTWNDDGRCVKIDWGGRYDESIGGHVGHGMTGALNLSGCTALKTLWCYDNQLTALDVSKNTALKMLWCYDNQLTALDVSKNTALENLDCRNNQLTALDVSKNTALEDLWCDNNQLTALDVSKNTALEYLCCDNNQLTALDVSKNTALKTLLCDNNQLTALDVSKNTALKTLWCSYNQLTALDVSKNTALVYLCCDNNQLTALSLGDLNLSLLSCLGNRLNSINASLTGDWVGTVCVNAEPGGYIGFANNWYNDDTDEPILVFEAVPAEGYSFTAWYDGIDSGTIVSYDAKLQICPPTEAAYNMLARFDAAGCSHGSSYTANAVNASCTQNGYTGDVMCSDCGELISEGSVIPALGHAITASTVAATCTAGGYTTHSCTRVGCGYSYRDSETVALGHSFERDSGRDVAPTCTKGGVEAYCCSRCAATDDRTLPANGHSFVNGICIICGARQNAAKLVVGSAMVRAGGTATVTVTMENNPGIVNMALDVSYDSRYLTLTSVTDGGLIGSAMHTENYSLRPYRLTWANDTATSDFTANGVIVTLVFTLAADTPTGEYPITLSYDNSRYDIVNYDFETVDFDVVNSQITVYDYIIGDVNGDGDINTADRMVLSRYLAKWDGYEAQVDMQAADINGDGDVNTADRMILARYLAKWDGYSQYFE